MRILSPDDVLFALWMVSGNLGDAQSGRSHSDASGKDATNNRFTLQANRQNAYAIRVFTVSEIR